MCCFSRVNTRDYLAGALSERLRRMKVIRAWLHGQRAFLGKAAGMASAVGLIASLAVGLPGTVPALATAGPALMPDGGQFVSVPIARELDTRFGTGGVPAQPIPANGTVTFPAAGG